MYYIILFLGVLTFLALAAWFDPSRRHVLASAAGSGNQGPHAPATDSLVAQLLKGERKEDKPCLTPIDCVQAKRCAGHCGCR